MYLLKLALRPWRIAPWSQMFSSLAVGFLLLLVGFLFWIQQGLKPVLVRLKGEQVITAYLSATQDSELEKKIVEKVRSVVGPSSSVEVQLVDQKEFLEKMRGQYPDLVRELEDLGSQMEQMIPRYISISGVFKNSVLDQIKTVPGVESAETSRDRYHHIVSAFSALRWVARILMFGICLALLTGLIHLSRMNGFLHRDVLVLLRSWGAGTSTLIAPSAISGLFVGVLGGALAALGWLTLGGWLSLHVRSLSVLLKTMPLFSSHLAILLFFIGTWIGMIAGVLGGIAGSQFRSDGGFGA